MIIRHEIGATELDPDEVEGLIPGCLQTQKELNIWEQKNIMEAQNWVFSRKRPDFLTAKFCSELHFKCLITLGGGRENFAFRIKTLEFIGKK